MHQPDEPDTDEADDAFLAEWAEAEARAAASLRDHLADRRGELPPPALDGALATLAASADRADPALGWLAAAAAIEPAELGDPDTDTLIDLLAASVSMVDDPGLPPEEAAAVMAVEYPDWAALVPQLVRAGPGAPADPHRLAALIERVAPDEFDDADLAALAHAFEIVLPTWEAIGVVDRDRRLTEAGAWLLPRAACAAWDSDFDNPQPYGPGHPAEPRWVPYLEDEPPDLEPDDAATAAAASRHLAAGALDILDLAGRVAADLERDLSPDELQSLLFDLPDTFPLRDGRWVHLPSLVEGTVATHRLTGDELDVGGLSLDPDLEHFTWWPGGDLPLAGGGTAAVRHRRGAPRPFLAGLVGPEGWLDGKAAGDLIAVRVDSGTLHVEQLGDDALDEQAGDRTAARLAETHAALGGVNAAGGPLDVPELLLETLARAPLTLARPQPPLGELLERAGLAIDDHAVAPVGEAGSEQEADFDDDDEFLTEVYGLDDHGVLNHRAVMAAVGLVDAGGVDALDEGQLGSLAAALAEPGVAESVADRVLELGRRGVDALDGLGAAVADHVRRRDRAGPLYVRARCAELAGRTEDGEALLHASLDADPAFSPALLEAAWYAEDRGDAQKAVRLLRRAGVDDDDAQAERLERWVRPAAAAKVGRNDPCPCGSGRKYKVCCQRRGGHPLSARAGWLLDKAAAYVLRPRQRPRLLGIVEARAGDAREPGRVVAAIRDPLVSDLAMFEENLLADFLDDRGVLLPADELELGRSWIGTRRGLYEVLDVRPGDGLTLLDLRAGDRVDVTERRASEVLTAGETLYARVLPAGATHFLTGGVRIPVQHRETLLAFLETDPDAAAQAAWVAALEAPPALATMEGEPMVHCEAVYELADVGATRAALAARYEPVDGDRWTEHVDVDGQRWSRGVLELDGDQLRVVTNSTARLERFKAAIAELAPGARLVDETRRPAHELLDRGGSAEEGGAAQDLPVEALEALEEQMIAFEQRWVDEPIPLLGGMTPRQARDDPTRRDQLLALLAEMDEATAGLPAGARGMEPDRIRRTLGLA